MVLDHLILPVNDLGESGRFYSELLGWSPEAEQPPFSVLRVTSEFTVQLAPWGTKGGQHLAFAMTKEAFDATFARICDAGISYGDAFDSVGNMRGPGEENGARGPGASLYFLDPNSHLIEIRHYGD